MKHTSRKRGRRVPPPKDSPKTTQMTLKTQKTLLPATSAKIAEGHGAGSHIHKPGKPIYHRAVLPPRPAAMAINAKHQTADSSTHQCYHPCLPSQETRCAGLEAVAEGIRAPSNISPMRKDNTLKAYPCAQLPRPSLSLSNPHLRAPQDKTRQDNSSPQDKKRQDSSSNPTVDNQQAEGDAPMLPRMCSVTETSLSGRRPQLLH